MTYSLTRQSKPLTKTIIGDRFAGEYSIVIRLIARSSSQPECYLEIASSKDSRSSFSTVQHNFDLPLDVVLAWQTYRALVAAPIIELHMVDYLFGRMSHQEILPETLSQPVADDVKNLVHYELSKKAVLEPLPPEMFDFFFDLRKIDFPLAFLPLTSQVLNKKLVWSEQLMLAEVEHPDNYPHLLAKASVFLDPYSQAFFSLAQFLEKKQTSQELTIAKALLAWMLLNGHGNRPNFALFGAAYLTAVMRTHSAISDHPPIDGEIDTGQYKAFEHVVDQILGWMIAEAHQFEVFGLLPKTPDIFKQIMEAYDQVGRYAEVYPWRDLIAVFQPELMYQVTEEADLDPDMPPLQDAARFLLLYRNEHPETTSLQMQQIVDDVLKMRRSELLRQEDIRVICAAAIDMSLSSDSFFGKQTPGTDFYIRKLPPLQAIDKSSAAYVANVFRAKIEQLVDEQIQDK